MRWAGPIFTLLNVILGVVIVVFMWNKLALGVVTGACISGINLYVVIKHDLPMWKKLLNKNAK